MWSIVEMAIRKHQGAREPLPQMNHYQAFLLGGTKRATFRKQKTPLLRLQSSEGKFKCLAKSSPYAGPSAGTEVARLQWWRVWCILVWRSAARDLTSDTSVHVLVGACSVTSDMLCTVTTQDTT